jgi:hypothetical protein
MPPLDGRSELILILNYVLIGQAIRDNLEHPPRNLRQTYQSVTPPLLKQNKTYLSRPP